MGQQAKGTETRADTSGFDARTFAPIVATRYGDRAQSIDDVIAALQRFKSDGATTVAISDGYYGYAFNARFETVPNFDAPRHVILRPVRNAPDHDGITRETSIPLVSSSSRSA